MKMTLKRKLKETEVIENELINQKVGKYITN